MCVQCCARFILQDGERQTERGYKDVMSWSLSSLGLSLVVCQCIQCNTEQCVSVSSVSSVLRSSVQVYPVQHCSVFSAPYRRNSLTLFLAISGAHQ